MIDWAEAFIAAALVTVFVIFCSYMVVLCYP